MLSLGTANNASNNVILFADNDHKGYIRDFIDLARQFKPLCLTFSFFNFGFPISAPE